MNDPIDAAVNAAMRMPTPIARKIVVTLDDAGNIGIFPDDGIRPFDMLIAGAMLTRAGNAFLDRIESQRGSGRITVPGQ